MNRSDPLTPEERALARLLGRAAPSAPSAALDEAVLAAARAAVQSAPVATAVPAGDPDLAPSLPKAAAPVTRRPRSRLPAALGLAASVVFAVGIAWQLKPDAPTPPALAEVAPAPAADAAQAPAAEDAAPAMAAADAVAAPMAQPQARQRSVAAAPAPAPAQDVQRQVAAQPAPSVVTPPMPPAPPAPASAPIPSAAAPRAEAYVMDSADARPIDSVTPTGERAQALTAAPAPMANDAARTMKGAPGVMRRAAPSAAAGALSASAVDAAVAADAMLPRKQWLKRIRERRDAGDRDTARASLERYLQQYPEARVPRDVRQLLDN
ncbi:hypothetical protein ABIA71_000337 [Stenotrophomonas sp. 2619]|uniref:hypothetical protein n=1 Tax=Stenotrophomonas sp. 2619 TaxID=3156316 RepID=UPI0033944959